MFIIIKTVPNWQKIIFKIETKNSTIDPINIELRLLFTLLLYAIFSSKVKLNVCLKNQMRLEEKQEIKSVFLDLK